MVVGVTAGVIAVLMITVVFVVINITIIIKLNGPKYMCILIDSVYESSWLIFPSLVSYLYRTGFGFNVMTL